MAIFRCACRPVKYVAAAIIVTSAFLRGTALAAPLPVVGELSIDGDQARITLSTDALVTEIDTRNPRELLLRFADAIDATRLSELQKDAPDWLAELSYGYDAVLIVATSKVKHDIELLDNGVLIRMSLASTAISESDSAQEPADFQTALQTDLLRATYKARTREYDDAELMLVELAERAPDDPQIYSTLADVDRQRGRWRAALSEYQRALILRPLDETLRRAEQELRDIHRPRIAGELINNSPEDGERRITAIFDWQDYLTDNIKTGLHYEVAKSGVDGLRRRSGALADFDGFRHRAALNVQYDWPEADSVQGTLFAGGSGPGLGLRYNFVGVEPERSIAVTYHEPSWDFVESFVQDGSRDQILGSYLTSFRREIPISFQAFLRRYNLRENDGLATSVGGNFTVAYPINQSFPQWEVGYVYDSEYRLTRTRRFDPVNNDEFFPIPLEHRELHFVQATVRHEWDEWLQARATLGYGKDRFGEAGPSAGAGFIADVTQDLQLRGDVSFGVDLTDTDRSVITASLGFVYRYAEDHNSGLKRLIDNLKR